MESPTLSPMPQTLDELARQQIKRWIESTGTTQTALSERIGRNQAWTSRYLAADFDADLETLQKIALVFGHNLTALLQIPEDPHEAALITAYRSLTPDARRLALDLLLDWSRARSRGRGRLKR
jgi:transcriptional regulator with XRE-family HTH domain